MAETATMRPDPTPEEDHAPTDSVLANCPQRLSEKEESFCTDCASHAKTVNVKEVSFIDAVTAASVFSAAPAGPAGAGSSAIEGAGEAESCSSKKQDGVDRAP